MTSKAKQGRSPQRSKESGNGKRKKFYEDHKQLILGFLCVVTIVVQAVFLYNTTPEADSISEYWIQVTGFAIFFCALQYGFRLAFLPLFFHVIEKRKNWEPSTYESKVKRACAGFGKLVFHTFTFCSWNYLLKDPEQIAEFAEMPFYIKIAPTSSSMKPWATIPSAWLWDWNTTRGINQEEIWNQPGEVGEEIRLLYRLITGYMFSELILLIPDLRSRSDFMEMSLHHCIAVSLVVSSYLQNMLKIGSLILYAHNISEVFIYLSRTTVDVNSPSAVGICFIQLCASFMFYRLYVFPCLLLRSVWKDSWKWLEEKYGSSTLNGFPTHIWMWRYFLLLLCLMTMLHFYWFCLVIRSGFNFAKTGQAKDLASSLSFGNFKKRMEGKKKN